MQTASCEIILNEFKASVHRHVTAAEAMLLVQMHHTNAGQMPLKNVVIDKDEVKRTDQEERNRLAERYIVKHEDNKRVTISTVFPPGSKLPQKFSEITDDKGNQVFAENGALLTTKPEPKVEVVQKIKVGNKEYTAEELAKLVPNK